MKIERLGIKTANFKEQLNFYKNTLSLKTTNETVSSFEVLVGSSVLTFSNDQKATPYHIAFHIPPNQETEALDWIKQRVDVQKNGGEEIVDFSAWNAKSLYFYDADKNILEFISRADLYPPGNNFFSENSILAIAEIGLATKDIFEKFKVLHETCGLEKFDENFENFCAIGDDEGLIITIDKNKKDWFPTNDKAFASAFTLAMSRGGKKYKIIFEMDRLTINESGL